LKVVFSVKNKKFKNYFSLSEKKPLSLGRARKADVTIDDSLLSGLHCSLRIRKGYPYIEDQNSKNGVYINGLRVTGGRIFAEDVVMIGNAILQLDPIKNSNEVLLQLSSKALKDLSGIMGNRIELDTSTSFMKNEDFSGSKHGKIRGNKRIKLHESTNKEIQLPPRLKKDALMIDVIITIGFNVLLFILLFDFNNYKRLSDFIKLNKTNIVLMIFISFVFIVWNFFIRKKSLGTRYTERNYIS